MVEDKVYVAPSTIMGRPSAASTTVGGRLRRPFTVEDSIVVDGATYGTICPTIYGTINLTIRLGSENRFLEAPCFLEGCPPSLVPIAVLPIYECDFPERWSSVAKAE